MKQNTRSNAPHIGRKIEKVRRLRGMTQTDLGDLLGVTKQAISKMEYTEKIDEEKLNQVAAALGVTAAALGVTGEGVKKLAEGTALPSATPFLESADALITSASGISNMEKFNHFSIEKTIKLFEELIKIEMETFESLKVRSGRQAKDFD